MLCPDSLVHCNSEVETPRCFQCQRRDAALWSAEGRLAVTLAWDAPRHRPRTWLPVSRPRNHAVSGSLQLPTCPVRPAGVLRKPAGHTLGALAKPIGRRGRPAGLGIGTRGPGRAPLLAPGAGDSTAEQQGLFERTGRGKRRWNWQVRSPAPSASQA